MKVDLDQQAFNLFKRCFSNLEVRVDECSSEIHYDPSPVRYGNGMQAIHDMSSVYGMFTTKIVLAIKNKFITYPQVELRIRELCYESKGSIDRVEILYEEPEAMIIVYYLSNSSYEGFVSGLNKYSKRVLDEEFTQALEDVLNKD